MIRPKKKLHLGVESMRVLSAGALQRVQGGVNVDRCSAQLSGCNPGQTDSCPTISCDDCK